MYYYSINIFVCFSLKTDHTRKKSIQQDVYNQNKGLYKEQCKSSYIHEKVNILSEHFEKPSISSKDNPLAGNGNPPDTVETHVSLINLVNVPSVNQATPFPRYGRKLHSEHLCHEVPVCRR